MLMALAACAAPAAPSADNQPASTAAPLPTAAPAMPDAPAATEAQSASEAPVPAQPEFDPTSVPAGAKAGQPAAQPTESPAIVAPEVPPKSPTPTPAIQRESRVVELEWPPRMRLGESDLVRVSLIPSEAGYTITTEFEGNEVVTRSVQVKRPAGAEVSLVGSLQGVGFVIEPPLEQRIELPEGEPATLRWSISPKQAGQQRLTLALLMEWAKDGRVVTASQVFSARHECAGGFHSGNDDRAGRQAGRDGAGAWRSAGRGWHWQWAGDETA